MDLDQIKTQRDLQLRRDILRAVDAAKAVGGMRGRLLASLLDEVEDDQHLLGLCVDLVNAGLLVERDLRFRTTERRTLDNIQYAVTAAGTAVLAGTQRHPLVADDRVPRA